MVKSMDPLHIILIALLFHNPQQENQLQFLFVGKQLKSVNSNSNT